MRLHVPGEFVFLGKCLVAQIAFERFESRVNAVVVLKVRAIDEALIANVARVGFDARDASVVVMDGLFVAKRLFADFALVVWGTFGYGDDVTFVDDSLFASRGGVLFDFFLRGFCEFFLTLKTIFTFLSKLKMFISVKSSNVENKFLNLLE